MSAAAPRLERLGRSSSPVVTIDGLTADWAGLVDAAAAMVPFPPAHGVYYPGLRRIFSEDEVDAWSRTRHLLDLVAPYVAGGFDCDGFTLVEASFSLVTTLPPALAPTQRHPHFDSNDPDFVALIAYLFDDEGKSGTVFYRHLASQIEVVDPHNRDRFIAQARSEAPALSGYFAPGDPGYDAIGKVEARFGRIGIWRGHLLHSGLIPPDYNFSPDPRDGRLTLNLFLQLARG
jgi:hypothetical protein